MDDSATTNAKFTFWQTVIVTLITAVVSVLTVMIDKGIDKPVSENKLDDTIIQSIQNHLNSDTTKNDIKLLVSNYSEKIPVGTIIASIFDYNTFLSVQNLNFTNDMTKALWVPCDGRSVNNSKYFNLSLKVNVPDLRGLFLRNVNNYNTSFPGVNPVTIEQKNPQDTPLGEYQKDAMRNITGSFLASNPNQGGTQGAFKDPKPFESGDHNSWGKNDNVHIFFNAKNSPKTRVGLENRPKNRTVTYFIKIN